MTDTNSADTSATEDLGAFEAEFYGSEPEKQPETAATEPAEPEPVGAAEGEEGGEGEQPVADETRKPKKTAQQRFDELTWRANEAERREQAARDELAALKAGKAPSADQPQGLAEGEPNPDDYEFGDEDAAYIRDHARFEARKEYEAEFSARSEEHRAIGKQVASFEAKAKAVFPDGEPDGLKAYRTMSHQSQVLNDIVLTSENGPQLAAHYGENTEALRRLEAMPQHLQVYELMKVENQLAANGASPADPKPKAKIVSEAPAPTPQVRGAGGQFTVSADTDDQEAFEREFYRR